MKTPAKLALLACAAHFGYAHDQGTHLNITFQALNYLTQTDPNRPNFLSLYPLLADGSWNEDNAFPQNLILGRFFFHFLPALNSPLPIAIPNSSVSATCDSNQWGLVGFSCAATYTIPLFIPSIQTVSNQLDDHTWQLAITAADPVTKNPTPQGWEHLGYLIHLLEDLTSPPHTRNSAHPCVGWLTFCDPFEPDNNFASVTFPVTGHDYASLSGATLDQFFLRLAQYTHDHYFSAFTVFNGDGTADYNNSNDGTYFYGTCLQATLDFNPGGCGTMGRKIARIGSRYHFLGQTPAKGWIDDKIAHEQFAELGPVAVQAVADFIKFYAPAIVVSTDGTPGSSISSTPPSINCGAICSALFVNGTNVQLTAQVPNGYTVQWQGACSGTSATVTISNLTSDTTCKAVFQPSATCPVHTICGTVTDFETGTVALHGIVTELRSSSGAFLQQTTTDNSGKYSFGSLTAPNYFVDTVVAAGEFSSPSQLFVSPGGPPANFKIGGVPASVTVSGPGSFTLAIFTLQPIPPGPPPCQGAGCPVSISGILPFSNPFSVRNGTWWLTCYVNDSVSQKTSNQQFAFTPQESISISCPP